MSLFLDLFEILQTILFSIYIALKMTFDLFIVPLQHGYKIILGIVVLFNFQRIMGIINEIYFILQEYRRAKEVENAILQDR